MRMTDADYNAKSIHIFAWPFTWKDQKYKFANFPDALQEAEWVPVEDSVTDPDDYMLKQYMTKSSRKIFLHTDSNEDIICIRLQKRNVENYQYRIVKKKKNLDVILNISGIELHLYRYGYGILFIRADNPDANLDTIKLINDYGRRIELPILIEEGKNFSLCADEIGIPHVDANLTLTPGEPAPFLEKLILGDTKENVFKIEGTADDRMFLMCLVRNNRLSWRLPGLLENDLEDSELEKLLYTIIFSDPDDPTCQNKAMRRRYLKDSVDPRWSEWGTIHAATNTTLFCITGEDTDIDDSVVKPFVVEYMYLLSLVIAQRIGLEHFSVQAGDKVIGADNKGLIKHEQVKELVNLQEQYVAFENQMMILKFTNQDQGIELYQILQKQLQVKDEQNLLDAQLESLYEVTNVSNDKWLQWIATLLAVLAIAIDIVLNVVILEKVPCETKIETGVVTGAISFVVLLITWVKLFRG